MPHCVVKQPNGLYAVWSTVVDHFVLVNATQDQVIEHECSGRYVEGYPGGADGMKRDVLQEFGNIEQMGRAFDWADTWPECLRWAVFMHDADDKGLKQMRDDGTISGEEWDAAAAWAKQQLEQAEAEEQGRS